MSNHFHNLHMAQLCQLCHATGTCAIPLLSGRRLVSQRVSLGTTEQVDQIPDLVVAPWQQFSSGAGSVIAFSPVNRPQSIDAPISGRVVRWFVQEGSRVGPGVPIVELADIDPEYTTRLERRKSADLDRVAAARASVQAYKTQAEAYESARELRVRSAEMKVSAGRQKLLAAKQKISAAQAELDVAKTQLRCQEGLANKGLISQRTLELTELAVAKAQAMYNTEQAAVNEAQANLVGLEAERLHVDAEVGRRFKRPKRLF